MRKNLKKVIGASLIAAVIVVSTGVGTLKTMASTNWDAIYKEAYDSVILVQKSQSQDDINKARVNIRKMTPAWMKGFVGEFSRQVDGVQQKIFERFYGLLYVNGDPKQPKQIMNQWEIDEARMFIEGFNGDVSNATYVPSWSSAVDKYQDIHIKRASDAVELVKTTMKLSDAYDAYKKIDTIISARNNKLVSDFGLSLKQTLHEITGRISKDTLDAIKFMEELDEINVNNLNSTELASLKQRLQEMKTLANKLDDNMKNSLLDRISFCEENM